MVQPADAGVAPSACTVEITTTPPGAEIVGADDHVLGIAPNAITLPCNTSTSS